MFSDGTSCLKFLREGVAFFLSYDIANQSKRLCVSDQTLVVTHLLCMTSKLGLRRFCRHNTLDQRD